MKPAKMFVNAIVMSIVFYVIACKKDDTSPSTSVVPPGNTVSDTTILPPVEPPIANTMGFFLDDWQAKTFTTPSFTEATPPTSGATVVTVDASAVITKIPLSASGQNSVWWMGPLSTQAMADVKNLHPHIIRFPGGNASNVYFWNAQQDQPPADAPSTYIDKDG